VITIDVAQAIVKDWSYRNFGDETECTPEVAALGLIEEVGEVTRALVKRSQGIRGTHAEWTAELAKELADVLIKVLDVGSRLGINVEDAFHERWAVVGARDWRADPVGHGISGAESQASNVHVVQASPPRVPPGQPIVLRGATES
jgi:NTP pyrophosphatase (non-canonical NTP hydrolase)